MSPRNLARALLGLLLLGQIGIAAELLLAEHYERWQIVPLALLAIALPLTLMAAGTRRPWSLHALSLVMLLFLLGGGLGLVLHYRGNVEFELERHAAAHGSALFWAAIRGATPALAPGTLIQLGLLGLLYTRLAHPRRLTATTAPGDHP